MSELKKCKFCKKILEPRVGVTTVRINRQFCNSRCKYNHWDKLNPRDRINSYRKSRLK